MNYLTQQCSESDIRPHLQLLDRWRFDRGRHADKG